MKKDRLRIVRLQPRPEHGSSYAWDIDHKGRPVGASCCGDPGPGEDLGAQIAVVWGPGGKNAKPLASLPLEDQWFEEETGYRSTTVARTVNRQGDLAGTSGRQGTAWKRNDRKHVEILDKPEPGLLGWPDQVIVVDNNDRNVRAGKTIRNEMDQTATRWDPQGEPHELIGPRMLYQSELIAVNNRGHAIGRAYDFDESFDIPVVWIQSQPHELPCLPAALYCQVTGINPKGEISGTAWFDDDSVLGVIPAAIVWTAGPTS
jgi:hypothetical protein